MSQFDMPPVPDFGDDKKIISKVNKINILTEEPINENITPDKSHLDIDRVAIEEKIEGFGQAQELMSKMLEANPALKKLLQDKGIDLSAPGVRFKIRDGKAFEENESGGNRGDVYMTFNTNYLEVGESGGSWYLNGWLVDNIDQVELIED